MIWEELNPSLLFTGLEARGYTDIFETLGSVMIQKGYAKDSYIDALIEREQAFPTGLSFNGIGVALPHTDPKYVNRGGIAIASLNHPVTFFQMGTDCDPIQVSLVFMLTVTDPSQHIDRLLRILDILQDSNILKQLIHARSCQDIIEIMKAKETKMMKKKIIVACGGAVATSTIAACKIMDLCQKHGISADICQVRISEIESNLSDASLIVTTSRVKRDYGIPLITGTAFISGIGIQKTEEDILEILKK